LRYSDQRTKGARIREPACNHVPKYPSRPFRRRDSCASSSVSPGWRQSAFSCLGCIRGSPVFQKQLRHHRHRVQGRPPAELQSFRHRAEGVPGRGARCRAFRCQSRGASPPGHYVGRWECGDGNGGSAQRGERACSSCRHEGVMGDTLAGESRSFAALSADPCCYSFASIFRPFLFCSGRESTL